MAVNKRGGAKRVFSNLEIRRKKFDALSELDKQGQKRPGSHKKQA